MAKKLNNDEKDFIFRILVDKKLDANKNEIKIIDKTLDYLTD